VAKRVCGQLGPMLLWVLWSASAWPGGHVKKQMHLVLRVPMVLALVHHAIASQVGRNVIHGSYSVENGQKEVRGSGRRCLQRCGGWPCRCRHGAATQGQVQVWQARSSDIQFRTGVRKVYT